MLKQARFEFGVWLRAVNCATSMQSGLFVAWFGIPLAMRSWRVITRQSRVERKTREEERRREAEALLLFEARFKSSRWFVRLTQPAARRPIGDCAIEQVVANQLPGLATSSFRATGRNWLWLLTISTCMFTGKTLSPTKRVTSAISQKKKKKKSYLMFFLLMSNFLTSLSFPPVSPTWEFSTETRNGQIGMKHWQTPPSISTSTRLLFCTSTSAQTIYTLRCEVWLISKRHSSNSIFADFSKQTNKQTTILDELPSRRAAVPRSDQGQARDVCHKASWLQRREHSNWRRDTHQAVGHSDLHLRLACAGNLGWRHGTERHQRRRPRSSQQVLCHCRRQWIGKRLLPKKAFQLVVNKPLSLSLSFSW